MHRLKIVALLGCLCGLSSIAHGAVPGATTVTINPSDDGSIYTCDACNHDPFHSYVTVGGYIQGVIRFPTAAITDPVVDAFLTVTHWTDGQDDPNVAVYGIASGGSSISFSDGNAGTFLGYMHLPANFVSGQDASFDVSSFLAQVHNPYVGFNLRTIGLDIFASLEYNIGHASQLYVTFAPVPEPSTTALLTLGVLCCVAFRRR